MRQYRLRGFHPWKVLASCKFRLSFGRKKTTKCPTHPWVWHIDTSLCQPETLELNSIWENLCGLERSDVLLSVGFPKSDTQKIKSDISLLWTRCRIFKDPTLSISMLDSPCLGAQCRILKNPTLRKINVNFLFDRFPTNRRSANQTWNLIDGHQVSDS